MVFFYDPELDAHPNWVENNQRTEKVIGIYEGFRSEFIKDSDFERIKNSLLVQDYINSFSDGLFYAFRV